MADLGGTTVVKTHDLIRLIAEAADDTPDFAQFEEAAEILTPYVSVFRYPGLRMTPCRRARNLTRPCNMPTPFTLSS